jgi:hypothetical protein
MIKEEYKEWIVELKGKIRSAQAKAAISVNTELIRLYCKQFFNFYSNNKLIQQPVGLVLQQAVAKIL